MTRRTSMAYKIEMGDNIQYEISATPEKVRRKLRKDGNAQLRTAPATPRPPAIKKLIGWKDLYRLRLNDYRLVYRVEHESEKVTLLFIGPRDKVYEQLGHDPDKNQPTARIIADEQVHKLLEREPEPEEFSRAFEEMLNEPTPTTEPEGKNDAPLPLSFNSDLLDSLDIALEHRRRLLRCKTEGHLLNCDVPPHIREKILNSLWPALISQVIESPKYEIDSDEALEELAQGSRPLESFLLALDDAQKPLTNRFKRDNPRGPWIVKGGPGSGKSTMLLYCIRNLLRNHRSQLDLEPEPLRILLTTYTKALVEASKYLINILGIDSSKERIDIIHADKLVNDHLPLDWKRKLIFPRDKETDEIVRAAIKTCYDSDKSFSFKPSEKDFLFEELDSVIVGNEISSSQQYASFERTGRGRRLGQNQRKQIWAFWLAFEKETRSRQFCTLYQRFAAAIESATATYDYVFIDEAQDLSPVALRMCIKLAVNPSNVFVTADRNQSIFGSGFSWNRVHEDLDFRGRSTILRRNYRTTHEIIDAIRHLLATDEQVDDETLNDQPVRHGEMPELRFASQAQEIGVLEEWLTRSLLKERVGCDCAAVLCPTNAYRDRIAKEFSPKFNALAMNPRDVDLGHPGVKVMTMHTAKGLQFPLVAVVGLSKDFPWRARGGKDQEETDQQLIRTFFVACSRAMSRLLVVGDPSQPSPFLKGFNEKHWDIS